MTPTHEIHSSELRSYRTCRQLWDWRHRGNWEPIKKPAPLEDGTVWHKALEVLYDPDTWTRPLAELHAAAKAAIGDEASKQCREYLQRAGKYQLDDDEATDYAERVTLLRSMLTRLCRTLDRDKYRPIAVEKEFSCPIRNMDGKQMACSCSKCIIAAREIWPDRSAFPPPEGIALTPGHDGWPAIGLLVTFNCRIDAVLEDREGFVYATDHKTTAQLLKTDSVIPELEDQLPSYLWCLRENGYLVTGMILNQFRKAVPKPPKRLENKQQGRSFSVNRMQLTDVSTARTTFQRHDAAAYSLGLYNDYLAWLAEFGPQYTRQFVVIKTAEQLDQVANNIRLQAAELLNLGPMIYPNPSRMNCDPCSFQLPCFSKQSGQDWQGELEASFVVGEPYYEVRRRT